VEIPTLFIIKSNFHFKNIVPTKIHKILFGWVCLGDFKQGGYQPEISIAKEIEKVDCEGYLLIKICSQN
jgi:hypothetical protein